VTDSTITNILVAGIGGQGVMTAAEILAQTALAQGFDVKKTEVAGMAQRGGVVTSHIRFGEKVNSPAIPKGEVDLLLGFEPAEAARWLDQLKPGGAILVNQNRPLSVLDCMIIQKTLSQISIVFSLKPMTLMPAR